MGLERFENVPRMQTPFDLFDNVAQTQTPFTLLTKELLFDFCFDPSFLIIQLQYAIPLLTHWEFYTQNNTVFFMYTITAYLFFAQVATYHVHPFRKIQDLGSSMQLKVASYQVHTFEKMLKKCSRRQLRQLPINCTHSEITN